MDRQLKRNATTPEFTPPKSKAGIRTLPLPALAIAELLRHLSQYPLGPAGLLFTTPAGAVLNQNNWRRREWNRARTWAYGVPRDLTFHRLRHTYASLLIHRNVHEKVLQVRLGHASAAETMDTYGHLYPDTDQSTRTAIDAAFSVASNVAGNVAHGLHRGRRSARNRRSRGRCWWGAWDSNPQPTVKSPYSYILVQISAVCRVHLIPFHPDSSPRLYRHTPRHTAPSRTARSPHARTMHPKLDHIAAQPAGMVPGAAGGIAGSLDVIHHSDEAEHVVPQTQPLCCVWPRTLTPSFRPRQAPWRRATATRLTWTEAGAIHSNQGGLDHIGGSRCSSVRRRSASPVRGNLIVQPVDATSPG